RMELTSVSAAATGPPVLMSLPKATLKTAPPSVPPGELRKMEMDPLLPPPPPVTTFPARVELVMSRAVQAAPAAAPAVRAARAAACPAALVVPVAARVVRAGPAATGAARVARVVERVAVPAAAAPA